MLVIVPASGEQAYSHFRETIERLWSLGELLERLHSFNNSHYLPNDLVSRLRRVDRFAIWGAIPGSPAMDSFWRKLGRDEEDVVAFYRRGKIVCWGKIFAWIRDRVLAEALWGRDERGRTWEYVYFIRDICWAEISWEVLREKLGYKPGAKPQGHLVVRDDIFSKIVKKYGSVWGFLESLAGVSCSGGGGSGLRGFRVDVLQLPVLGGRLVDVVRGRLGFSVENSVDAVLVLYGWGIVSLIDCCISKGFVSKEFVEELERKVFGGVIARFYNDLRRLGVISVGGVSNWDRSVDARLTVLSRDVAGCLDVLRRNGVVLSGVDLYLFVGSLAIVYCMVIGDRVDVDAGVCAKISRGAVEGDKVLAEIVRRAVGYLVDPDRSMLMLPCMGYGVDLEKLKRFLRTS